MMQSYHPYTYMCANEFEFQRHMSCCMNPNCRSNKFLAYMPHMKSWLVSSHNS